MSVPARWFHETLWGHNVWYMDCPRVPRFVPRRRVALVVDTTTDSWPWSGQRRPLIRSVLDELDCRLEPDDRCALWLLGPRDPVIELTRGPQSQQLAGRLIPALKPYERGSWLADTVTGIDLWSRCAGANEWEDYLLILTDGEIHDGAVAPLPSAIGPERIAMILPPLAPGERDQPAASHELGQWARVMTRWSGSLALLDCAPPVVRLDYGAATLGVYRYDQAPITLVSGTPQVQPEGQLAICFLGGQTPAPAFRIGLRTEPLSTDPQHPGYPQDARALHMRRITRLLLAPWNRSALSRLAQGDSVEVEHCGKPQLVDPIRPPNEQPCTECKGCLLIEEAGFTIGSESQDKVLLFPLSPDGSVTHGIPMYQSASTISETCYSVHATGGLVLRFIPTVI